MAELLYNEIKEERHPSKQPGRNHVPAFKAKVTLDALKGELTSWDIFRKEAI